MIRVDKNTDHGFILYQQKTVLFCINTKPFYFVLFVLLVLFILPQNRTILYKKNKLLFCINIKRAFILY